MEPGAQSQLDCRARDLEEEAGARSGVVPANGLKTSISSAKAYFWCFCSEVRIYWISVLLDTMWSPDDLVDKSGESEMQEKEQEDRL